MTDTNSNIPPSQCQVSGRVSFIGGKAAVDVTLRAYDRDLGGDKEIGTVVSDANGYYKILYSSAQLRESGKGAADLIVMAFATDGKLLLASDLQPGAPAILTLDLAIAQSIAEPSQYEQLRDAIVPRLRDTALQDLTDDNIQYLATVTGQDAKKIERLVYSARCAQELNRGASDPLPESVFFALSSQGLPTDPAALLREPRARLTQALVRSHADNIVAAPDASLVQKLRDGNSLLAKRAATVMTEPAVAREWPEAVADFLWHRRVEQELAPTTGQHLTVADLFATSTQPDSGLAEDKQRVVAELVASLDKPAQVDPASLKAKGFEAAEIATVERIFGLADLARQHLPMVRALNAIASVDGAAAGSLVYLARLHSDDWRRHVEAVGTPSATEGENEDAREATYAAELERRVESTFRTAVVAARIEQSRMALPEQSKPDLNTFFHNNPDFEFGKQYVHTLLGEGGSAKLDGVEDPLALKRSLLKLERTVKLTDNYRQHSVLLAKGFDSAQQIARYGKRDFVKQLGAHSELGSNAAEMIYARAEQTTAVALNLLMRHRDSGINLPVMARANVNAPSLMANDGTTQIQLPDLTTLFGSLDGGACDPCLSVTSPAAYLADLLHYLKDRKLDPRLAVAGIGGMDTGPIVAELDQSKFPDSLRLSLSEKTQIPLTAAASVLVIDPAVEWSIDDHAGQLELFNGSFLYMQRDVEGVKISVTTSSLYEDRDQLNQKGPPISVVNAIPKIEVLKRLDPNQMVNPTSPMIGVDDKGGEWYITFKYEVRFHQRIEEGNGNGEIKFYFGYWASGLTNLTETQFSDGGAYQAVYNALSGGILPDLIKNDIGSNWPKIENTSDTQGGAEWRLSVDYRLNIYFSESFSVQYLTDVRLLDVLLSRRPDLIDTEFSCENSNTLLPYVDLTTEVLERAAAQSYPRAISISPDNVAAIISDLNARKIAPQLAQAPEFVPSLPKTAQVQVGIADREWYIRDTGRQYGLRSGLTIATDGLPPTFLSTTNVGSDIKILNSRAWPESVRGATKSYNLYTATFGQGYFFPTLGSVDIDTAGNRWTASYRYLVNVTYRIDPTHAGSPQVFVGVGPGWGFKVREDQVVSILGPLNNGQVPQSIRAELFEGRSGVILRQVMSPAGGVWEIWTDHRLSVEYHPLSLAWDVPQTSERSEEIAAQPEHFNASAYDALISVGYPWVLPFDLPAEEARIYLSHLGASRAVLVETFDRSTVLPNPELGPLTDANFWSAADRLGFNTADLRIISGEQAGTEGGPNPGPWNFWGFSGPDLSSDNSIPDPANTGARISQGRWVKVLTGRVDVFLQQSGLTYDELRELLDMRYVNTTDKGQWALQLELGSVDTGVAGDTRLVRSSDLSKASLVRAAPQQLEGEDDPEVVKALDRLHRFVRLWRKIGWPMRDLDQLADGVRRTGGASRPVLDENFIGFLDRLKQINQVHFHRPENFLDLFATNRYRDYATKGEPLLDCLYERLFLNKAITNPPDPAFELNAARNELRDSEDPAKPNLAKPRLPHIAAACGVSLQDASLLLDWHGDNPKLTLALLSSLFWVALIARSTNVAVQNFLGLFSLKRGDGLSALWSDPQTVVETTKPVELGLKFSATTAGEVCAIRYWKPEGETGEHVGRLWDSKSGSQLAEVRFRLETASGWQEQRLIAPVRIESGAVYVIAVNTNKRYAFTENGMVPSHDGWLKTVGDGQNGVMGDIDSFPVVSVNNPNYHRDVSFIPHFVASSRIMVPEAVRAAGFTAAETLYLLAHKQSSVDSAAEEASMALLLGELRTALSAIDLETTSAQNEPDLDGSGVRRELISLGWHPQVIDEVFEVLRAVYSVSLASLPPNLLPELKLPHVTYADGRLLSTTVLSKEERQVLLNLSQDPAFAAAAAELIALFALPEERIGRDLYSLEARDAAIGFEAWPSDLVVPPDLSKRLYYDAAMTQLHFIGAIDDSAFAQIKALPKVTGAFLAAITTLRSNYKTLPSNAAPLLSQAEQIKLLSELATPPDRYRFLLEKLVPHRRYVESLTAVRNKLQSSLGMESSVVGKLLSGWLISSGGADKVFAIADFLNSDFVQSAPSIPVTPDRFPLQFKTCVRLTKVAALVRKFKLTDASLSWLFSPSAGPFGWLDPNRLPAAPDESSVSIRPLLRAANLFKLRDALPDGEAALTRIFAAAADDAVSREQLLHQIHVATHWDVVDLSVLLGPDGFHYETDQDLRAAFKSEGLLRRLVDCFAVIKRIGASAAQCLAWSQTEVSKDAAADIRRVARARHTDSGWSTVAGPLRDALREKQRTALVAYLIGRDQLRDSTDLYDRYLIDVEMQPAALTSRIKQACASVQLFVQRCLLNIEPKVPPEAIDTDQWAWMKNYRVWEANRKVFLYPENWIEPELRDDKSEFFQQLESDLLQSNVTHEVGVEAFKSYAEKLGDVARITVVSMFDELLDGTRVTHLLGRDGSSPHRYFYRQWKIPPQSDAGYWTPWEEVTAGIDSDHVLIFKFAGSVHIAWPTVKPEGGDGMMKITMNLVHRRQAGWSGQKRGRGELWWRPPPNIDESRGLQFRVNLDDTNRPQISCFGADIEETFILKSKPIEFSVLNNADTGEQLGLIDIRNLAKYQDNFGRTYYWIAKDKEVDLFFIQYIHPFADGRNPHPNNGKSSTGGFVNIKAWLEVDLRLGMFGQIGHTLIVPGSGEKYKKSSLSNDYVIAKSTRFELKGDAILEIADSANLGSDKDEAVWSDRPIKKWSPLGLFNLDDRGSFSSQIGGTVPVSEPANVLDVQDFSSYYREVPVREVFKLVVRNPVSWYGAALLPLPKTGRFTTAESRLLSKDDPPLITAFSDNRYDLIFRANLSAGQSTSPVAASSSPPFAVVPASGARVRELRQSIGSGALLDAMALQESPPGARLVVGRAIDETRSILDIGISFDDRIPWRTYSWETFFHIPILVATQLTRNQRFEEAQRWLHLVFDPTAGQGGTDPGQYWRFKPFRVAGKGVSIEQALLALAAGNHSLHDQIAAWREHPFQPHAIARARTRAYQFFVVLKYLDNLIAWGDQLFRRDTIESINEATQLYILASEILGRRPQRVTTHVPAEVKTYRELPELDDFSNALAQVESLIPASSGAGSGGSTGAPANIYALYFCIPANEKLADYWDTVEKRLFDIRHSRNIEGMFRQLPLYEPPIDPAVLVRAVAAGVDISSALADLQSPLPLYRFNAMTQKALELANDVKGFGGSLLSALEKQDGEALSLLRSSQEMGLLKLIQNVKDKQHDEATANVESLRKTRELIAQRYLQYQRILGKTSVEIPAAGNTASMESTPSKANASPEAAGRDAGGLGLSKSEGDYLVLSETANNFALASSFYKTLSGVMHAIPDSTNGTPVSSVTFGGTHLGNIYGAIADAVGMLSADKNFQATRAATVGGHQRRYDEWAFQSNLAAKELEQVDKQIAAAELRVAIAAQELTNHQRQMDNAQQIDDVMHDKFTNVQLYRWMSGQAASMHFRAYQLAYDLAKRAERCYRFELGLEDKDSNFIRFGYWDSLKKGLLAGEALALDIKRMEVAYLDKNKRELEITKHVSLRQLDGDALLQLRANEACEFELPETLFDLDFPGHYFRRIKSVSISIPCVAGPYTSVSGTLTMVSSKLRGSAVVRQTYADESNYRSTYLPLQSIATSSGQNDSGLFELNFRDERYLPFEGGGAISRWRFALPKEFHAFDYSTISDLVVHIRYTARDGGESLSIPAAKSLLHRRNELSRGQDEDGGLTTLISVRQDFAAQWQSAKNQPDTPVALQLVDELFPYMFRSRVQVHATQFVWMKRDDKGHWKIFEAKREVVAEANKLPAVVIPSEVATATDEPWLIVTYRVDAAQPDGRVP